MTFFGILNIIERKLIGLKCVGYSIYQLINELALSKLLSLLG